jgi:hypothetical protein
MATRRYEARVRTSYKAVLSLILGIVGFFFLPIIISIFAIIFGWSALADVERTPALKGKDMAVVGLALGIAGIILAIAGWIVGNHWSWLIFYMF